MKQIIAVIFDFDDTLAPDSTSGYLESRGIDVKKFWREKVGALIREDWDPVPAYFHAMIRQSQSMEEMRFNRKSFISYGKQHKLFTGVARMFDGLARIPQEINPDIKLEFYLISSGIGEILRNTSIAKRFRDIWASDFSYDENDEIVFPRKVVSFTDKTRYLFQISKGIVGPSVKGKPFDVNKKVRDNNFRVPFDQMIFVGDGMTDIPCFSLIQKNSGVAIGVYDSTRREKFGKAWGFIEDRRVSNLVPADYTRNSALMNSLSMAVESISQKVTLRSQTFQG